jgi:hypothetical protein
LGYKSGVIHDMARHIYESYEYVKFINNSAEKCTTFLNTAVKKYNSELSLIERSCLGVENPDKKKNKDVREDIKLLAMYSHINIGLQAYFDKICGERKELAKREEIIQNELDKIENTVTNFIMPCVESVMLRLSTLRSFSMIKGKYDMVGLDHELINFTIRKFFEVYAKFEELNLAVVEAKLDIKNFYAFLNKNAIKISSLNHQAEEAENALNPLNKVIFDCKRLISFLSKDQEIFKLDNLRNMLEKTPKLLAHYEDKFGNDSIESVFIENLKDTLSNKKSRYEENKYDSDISKINLIISDIKECFNKMYELPKQTMTKFFQSSQEIIMTDQMGVVCDMYVDSIKTNSDSSFNTHFGEESKTCIKETNLSDCNDFKSDVVF